MVGREEGAEGGFASFVVLFMLEFKMREFIIWRERERERERAQANFVSQR